ncbi:MAG: hypothetical protein H0T84_02915 [Tatlockia sp.]|nr:hypothetical protein [Tatlockia sp.]
MALIAGIPADHQVMPLIVTNAEIWVIDYKEIPISAKTHKWVKHKVKSNKNLSLFVGDTLVFTYLANVVNINYLKEFLDKSFNMNRSNGTIGTLNNTEINSAIQST